MALDAEGWTILTPSVDSRVIYLSTSEGSDSNDGLSTGAPVATFVKAMSLMRNGYPDWILFKAGDTFSFGGLSIVNKCGRSASEPFVFTSYGTGARPIINGQGFFTYQSTNTAGFSFNYVSFVGFDFRANANAQTGITISGRANHILIEDCRFQEHSYGLNIQNVDDRLSNLSIRRCAFADNGTGCTFIKAVDTLFMHENIFDYGGWGGGGYGGGTGASIFRHNNYLRDVQYFTATNNINSRASDMGFKMAGNGYDSFNNVTVENNLFYNSQMSMSASDGATDPDSFRFSTGLIRNNVFTENGRTFSDGSQKDLQIYTTNSQDYLFAGNLFVHMAPLIGGPMIVWGGNALHRNITLQNNIVYDWDTQRDSTYYWDFDIVPGIPNYVKTNNQVDLPAESYYAPTRTVGSYYASIGGTNDAVAFMLAARDMHKANWNPAYTADAVNDYMREGFSSPQRVHFFHAGGLTFPLQAG